MTDKFVLTTGDVGDYLDDEEEAHSIPVGTVGVVTHEEDDPDEDGWTYYELWWILPGPHIVRWHGELDPAGYAEIVPDDDDSNAIGYAR